MFDLLFGTGRVVSPSRGKWVGTCTAAAGRPSAAIYRTNKSAPESRRYSTGPESAQGNSISSGPPVHGPLAIAFKPRLQVAEQPRVAGGAHPGGDRHASAALDQVRH